MARTPYLIKELKATDINCRLSWPSRLLSCLHGRYPTRNRVYFQVRDANGGMWRLCCSTRQRRYYKPVITGDWLRFVKSKNLKVGDKVIFYEDSDHRAHFLVAVKRVGRIRLLGHDVVGYTNEE